MDVALKAHPAASADRLGLLWTALVPVVPQILGSAFNIAYNTVVVKPLLDTPALEARFLETVVLFNAIAYPVTVGIWVWSVLALRPLFRRLLRNEPVDPTELDPARRRVVHLPYICAAVSGAGWLVCIPVFVAALAAVDGPLSAPLLWHLPISFLVTAFIAITQSFFLVEIVSQRWIYPAFFHGVRPDQLAGVRTLSLRGRGLVWAISAGVCPIISLLLLNLAPRTGGIDYFWFEAFVGGVGILFGLVIALLMSRLVAEPVDQLRAATQAIGRGDFEVQVPLCRADEFGNLIGEFNHMAIELREKERLRQTFGLHVGRKAAAQILARDPGLNGIQQVITVMFVDIRGFTARAADTDPRQVVVVLNEFLRVMVRVAEEQHSGMVNKFLGDGFMALFGAGEAADHHADEALQAAREMMSQLEDLNARFRLDGKEPLAIGIGLQTGPAIVGSIGSPERLEFTAIGNTVNLASRIESLTKTVGETLLISEATRAALTNTAGLRRLPPERVKGVDEPVLLWAADSLR